MLLVEPVFGGPMIDFSFSPEIEDVRLKVRAFMDEQVRPRWESIDQNDLKSSD